MKDVNFRTAAQELDHAARVIEEQSEELDASRALILKQRKELKEGCFKIMQLKEELAATREALEDAERALDRQSDALTPYPEPSCGSNGTDLCNSVLKEMISFGASCDCGGEKANTTHADWCVTQP